MSGDDFTQATTPAYAEVVRYVGITTFFSFHQARLASCLRLNLPDLFFVYGEGSALESVALTVAMVPCQHSCFGNHM